MPFGTPFLRLHERLKATLADEIDLRTVEAVADTASDIIDEIYLGILACDVFLADITDGNLNVYHEIGMAQVCRKPIIYINDKRRAVTYSQGFPFNIRAQRIHSYSRTNINKLAEVILQRARTMQERPGAFASHALSLPVPGRRIDNKEQITSTLLKMVRSASDTFEVTRLGPHPGVLKAQRQYFDTTENRLNCPADSNGMSWYRRLVRVRSQDELDRMCLMLENCAMSAAFELKVLIPSGSENSDSGFEIVIADMRATLLLFSSNQGGPAVIGYYFEDERFARQWLQVFNNMWTGTHSRTVKAVGTATTEQIAEGKQLLIAAYEAEQSLM